MGDDGLWVDPLIEPCVAPEETVLESDEDQATIPSLRGWMTLLGENGSGKSSILQAVALALAGERILDDKTLDPRRFLRIHRSIVVNLDFVRELRSLSHGEYSLLLRDGTELTSSRRFREKLDRVLDDRR